MADPASTTAVADLSGIITTISITPSSGFPYWVTSIILPTSSGGDGSDIATATPQPSGDICSSGGGGQGSMWDWACESNTRSDLFGSSSTSSGEAAGTTSNVVTVTTTSGASASDVTTTETSAPSGEESSSSGPAPSESTGAADENEDEPGAAGRLGFGPMLGVPIGVTVGMIFLGAVAL